VHAQMEMLMSFCECVMGCECNRSRTNSRMGARGRRPFCFAQGAMYQIIASLCLNSSVESAKLTMLTARSLIMMLSNLTAALTLFGVTSRQVCVICVLRKTQVAALFRLLILMDFFIIKKPHVCISHAGN
jgi:hypothetical protein